MGASNVRWLLAELPRLVSSGVLETDSAERLRAHFEPQIQSRKRWIFVGLGILGAALIGAGITMLLAHNWEALTRPMRAAIALGLLVVAQGIAGFAFLRRSDSVAWREASSVGWVFALGATLGLISQTYHVILYPGPFLGLWTVLALPILWLMRSRVATALAWCGAAPAAMIGLRSSADMLREPFAFWLLGALLLPTMAILARHLRDERLASLPFWAAAYWIPMAGFEQMETVGGRAWVLYVPALFAAMHALGSRIEPATLSAWRRPLWVVGGVGLAGVLLVLSFADVWNEGSGWYSSGDPLAWRATVGVSIVLSLFAAWQAVAAFRARAWPSAMLLAAPILVACCATATTRAFPAAGAALVCSLWLLAVGLLSLFEGARHGQMGLANTGMALLAALAIARFFDSDVTLLTRGIAFMVVGAAFLSVNLWMLKRRQGVEP